MAQRKQRCCDESKGVVMMKTRKYSWILLILLILALSGSVVAYMYQKTATYNNELVPATVACSVSESFNAATGVKSSVKIVNNSNIPAYLRLRLVSYWVDSSGNKVAKPSQVPAFTLASGWIAGPNDTYYYPSPVAVGGETTNLLASSLTLAANDANGYSQVVEVFAEAIQSLPTDAVVSEWNVTLTEGSITAVASAP